MIQSYPSELRSVILKSDVLLLYHAPVLGIDLVVVCVCVIIDIVLSLVRIFFFIKARCKTVRSLNMLF